MDDKLEGIKSAALATLAGVISDARAALAYDPNGESGVTVDSIIEARDYLADLLPDMANYPLIASDIGRLGPDGKTVALAYLALRLTWRQMAGPLNRSQWVAQTAIAAATDLDGVNAALWAAEAAMNTTAKQAGVTE